MFSDFPLSVPVNHLADNEVHLWLVDIRDVTSPFISTQWLHLLTDEEQSRMQQFRKLEKQRQFVVARVALRLILNALLRKPSARDIVFALSETNKPFLQHNTQNIQFNLSHSGNVILIAVTRSRQCGVDIEVVNTGRDVVKLAEYYFHKEEYAALRHSEQSPDVMLFYKLWTLKEAFVKADGRGMAIPGDGYYFQKTDSATPQLMITPAVNANQNWLFRHFFYCNEYSAALAVEKTTNHPVEVMVNRLVFPDTDG